MGKMDKDQFATFAGAVVVQLPRNLDPRVAQFWIEDPGALRSALDGALRQTLTVVDPDAWVDTLDLTKIETREFIVTIDPNLTIEQMRDAGEYNYAHPAHTTAALGSCCTVTGTTPVTAKVVAFRIGRNTTSAQAKRVRDLLCLKPICIQHELAVGAQHKRAQLELGWIVNVDDKVVVVGESHVSCLNGHYAYRGLNLYGPRRVWWDGDTWFFGLDETACR